jgi:hypothetical protein
VDEGEDLLSCLAEEVYGKIAEVYHGASSERCKIS